MKKYLLTFLLLLPVLGLIAQKSKRKSQKTGDNSDQRWHEIEFNSVFLLQEIFRNGGGTDLGKAYLVGYKTGKGNIGMRFGFGGRFIWKSEQESLIDERGLTEYALRARIGIEWRKNLMERWQLISGIDAVAESFFSKDRTKTSFDVIRSTESEQVFGAGPLVGIRFWLNDRISLSTETAFHALYVKRVEEVDSQELPDFDSKKVIFEYPIRFDPPVNLYLLVRF